MLARRPAPARRTRLRRERTSVEGYLFALGRKLALGCPGVAPLAADPADTKANQAPFSSFTVNPPGPGYKAGQTLTFEANGSRDPDGRITRYVWSDGVPPHAVANGFKMTRWYGAPGTYTITLTVTDDGDARTFTSKTFYVGGPGSDAAAQPRQLAGQDRLPGPGREPARGRRRDPRPVLCRRPDRERAEPVPGRHARHDRDAGQGNPAGVIDEWGRPRDPLRIAYRLDHAGPGAVARTSRSTGPRAGSSPEPVTP